MHFQLLFFSSLVEFFLISKLSCVELCIEYKLTKHTTLGREKELDQKRRQLDWKMDYYKCNEDLAYMGPLEKGAKVDSREKT